MVFYKHIKEVNIIPMVTMNKGQSLQGRSNQYVSTVELQLVDGL